MTFFLSFFATPVKIQNNPITERAIPKKNSSMKINIMSGSPYDMDAS